MTTPRSPRHMARPLTGDEALELNLRAAAAAAAMDASESGDPIIAAGILNAPLGCGPAGFHVADLEEDPDAPDDGFVYVAGVLYDAETGEERPAIGITFAIEVDLLVPAEIDRRELYEVLAKVVDHSTAREAIAAGLDGSHLEGIDVEGLRLC